MAELIKGPWPDVVKVKTPKELAEEYWNKPGVVNPCHINIPSITVIQGEPVMFPLEGEFVRDDGNKKLREFLAGIRKGEKT